MPPEASGLTLRGRRPAVPYQLLAFTFSAQNTSTGPFTYQINWGDGQFQTVTGDTPIIVSHTFTTPGQFRIDSVVSDPYGDISPTVSTDVNVTNPHPSGYGPSRDAFVTTLYLEQLGRYPEPNSLAYWSRKLASGLKPLAVAIKLARSPEHRLLIQRHLIPQTSLARSYANALLAGRKAARSHVRPRSVRVKSRFEARGVPVAAQTVHFPRGPRGLGR